MKNLEVIATVEGSYINSVGEITNYSYRIFNLDTVETVLRYMTETLINHPNAKQTIVFENKQTQHYIEKTLKGDI